jgi:DoxX-like protein
VYATYLIVTLVTAIATTVVAVLDYARHDAVVDNSSAVGVPVSWLPVLGTLKLAGAGGLVAGLLGIPLIGVAAAAGLVLFFVGAVIAHVRAGVLHTIHGPGGFLALSVASLVLAVTH